MNRFISFLGLLAILLIGCLFSTDRRRINLRTVLMGVVLQLILGIVLLRIELTANAFAFLSGKVASFLALSKVGGQFVFGLLADAETMNAVFEKAAGKPFQGFLFAFHVIPTIIFFASFISILYYLGVMQIVVEGIARVMRTTMKTSGAETLSCAGNIFVGMTEAPLLIKPYVDKMTLSELNAVMTGGFATIAGGVMAAYIGMGISPRHLIIASVMSAPAALVLAKMFVPETEHSVTAGDVRVSREKSADNVLDAIVRGATDGLHLAINVAAMLIAFLALLAFVDVVLKWGDGIIDHRLFGYEEIGSSGEYLGLFPGSIATLLGTILAPLAWLMGVPWAEAGKVGHLLGLKLSANEFVAYSVLANHIKGVEGFAALSERSQIIATYALCGFANFGSIGITIGGISAIAPTRRGDLSRLGLKAMIAGALASWMTATIAGMLLS